MKFAGYAGAADCVPRQHLATVIRVREAKRLRPRLYISTGWGKELNRHSYLRKCKLRIEMD